MANKGQALTITVTAFNTTTGAPQLNDAANVTLKVVKDGVEAAPTNAPSNKSNGEIALALTAAEMTADTVVVSGSSVTANVVIVPAKIVTENLPTAVQVRTEMDANSTRLAKLNVSGTLAHTDNAATFKADVSSLATQASITALPAAVWSVGDRTLTGFGSLVSDIVAGVWGAAVRTLTDKTGFALATAPATPNDVTTARDYLAGAISEGVSGLSGELSDVNQGLLYKVDTRARPEDVQPTIAFSPTINPTPVTVNPTPVTVNPTAVTVQGGFDNTARTHLLGLENIDANALADEISSSIEVPAVDPSDWPAIKAVVLGLGARKIIVENSVSEAGEVILVRGGDYRIVDGRAPKFTLEGALYTALFASISQIKFIVPNTVGTFSTNASKSVVDGKVVVQVELTKAQTRLLTLSGGTYYLEAVLNDGTELPLCEGPIVVKPGGE